MLIKKLFSFCARLTRLKRSVIPIVCSLPVSLQADVTGPVDIHHLHKLSGQTAPVYMHIHLPNGLTDLSAALPETGEYLTESIKKLSQGERLLSVNYDHWLPEHLPLSLELCLKSSVAGVSTQMTLPLLQEAPTALQFLPGALDSSCSQVRLGHNTDSFVPGQTASGITAENRAYNLLLIELSKEKEQRTADDLLPIIPDASSQPSLASLLSGGAFPGQDDPFNKKRPGWFFSGNPSQELQLWAWSARAFLGNPEYDRDGAAMPSGTDDIVIETLYPDGHGTIRTYSAHEWLAMVQQSCGLDDDTVDSMVSWHRGAHITLYVKNPEALAGQDDFVLPYGSSIPGIISCMDNSGKKRGGHSQSSGSERTFHKHRIVQGSHHRLLPYEGSDEEGGDSPQPQPYCTACNQFLRGVTLQAHNAEYHPTTSEFLTAFQGGSHTADTHSDSSESESDDEYDEDQFEAMLLGTSAAPNVDRTAQKPAPKLHQDERGIVQSQSEETLQRVIRQLQTSFNPSDFGRLFIDFSEYLVLDEYKLDMVQYLEITSVSSERTITTLRDHIETTRIGNYPRLQANKIIFTALAGSLSKSFPTKGINIPQTLQAQITPRARYSIEDLVPVIGGLQTALMDTDTMSARFANPPGQTSHNIIMYINKHLKKSRLKQKSLLAFNQQIASSVETQAFSLSYFMTFWQAAHFPPEILIITLMSRGFEQSLLNNQLNPETNIRAAIMKRLASLWKLATPDNKQSYAALALDLMEENFLSQSRAEPGIPIHQAQSSKTTGDFEYTEAMTQKLDINDLYEIITKLGDANFSSAEWRQLGLALGGNNSRLETIKRSCHNDTSDCQCEMLSDWLKRNYNSHPEWRVMIKALLRINHAAALHLHKQISSEITLKTPLNINHLSIILAELTDVSYRSHSLGIALGLPSHALNAIRSNHRDVSNQLEAVITDWLTRKYTPTPSITRMFGQNAIPTIEMLVYAVGHRIGGGNPAVAEKIQSKYSK